MNGVFDKYNNYQVLGTYYPSVMLLGLNQPASILDLLTTNSFVQKQRTFYHEYLHFLQDITLAFAYANLHHFLNLLRTVYHSVDQKKGKSINLPFSFKDEKIFINIKLFEAYLNWSIEPSNYSKTEDTVIEVEERIETIDSLPVKKYILKLASNIEVCFGAHAIVEGMVHIVEEERYCPKSGVSPIPYHLPKEVFKYYLPKYGESETLILDLCEFSLDTMNPAETFIETLKRIQKMDDIRDICTEDNFYVWIKTGVEFSKDGVSFTPDSWWKKTYEDMPDMINGTYRASIYVVYKKWILGVLKKGMELRSQKPIFSKIYKGTFMNLSRPDEFLLWGIDNLGLPLVYNAAIDSFEALSNKDDALVCLPAGIHAVWQLLFFGEYKCFCKGYCNATAGHHDGKSHLTVDQNCDFSPWKKRHENGNGCLFTTVWQTLNLSGVKIKGYKM